MQVAVGNEQELVDVGAVGFGGGEFGFDGVDVEQVAELVEATWHGLPPRVIFLGCCFVEAAVA